jgi:hypothetical protein
MISDSKPTNPSVPIIIPPEQSDALMFLEFKNLSPQFKQIDRVFFNSDPKTRSILVVGITNDGDAIYQYINYANSNITNNISI